MTFHFLTVQSPTAITPATVSPQYLYNQEFTIGDFSGKKRANVEWLSPPIDTHDRGYKFRLTSVHPNGYGKGKRSNLWALYMLSNCLRLEYCDIIN